MSDNYKSPLGYLILLLVAAILIVFSIVAGGLEGVVKAISSEPLPILASAAIIAGEESLKSLRFVVASRAKGLRLRASQALKIHFASLAMGVITPAFSGSIPTATAMLGDELALDPATALSIALSVSFFDSMVPAIVVLVSFWLFFPGSLPLVLISAAVVTLWALAFNVKLSDSAKRFVSRRFGSRVSDFLESQVITFRGSLATILSNRRLFIIILMISVASYVIESASLLILAHGAEGLGTSFLALMMSYVGGNVPLPGGEGGVEYSLLLAEERSSVIAWRTSYLLVAFLSLILLNEIIRRYQNYAVRTYMLFRERT